MEDSAPMACCCLYDGGGQFKGTFDSKGSAWDK